MIRFAHMRRVMQETFKGLFPMQRFEEMGKQNMSIFENAMKMMNPFAQMNRGTGAAPSGTAAPAQKTDDIDSLKAQLDAVQAKLDKLAKDKT